MPDASDVLSVADVGWSRCRSLLDPFELEVREVAGAATIPGSYWGEAEAGLIGNVLFCRGDTPVHSLLHEACHFVCMDAVRRASLERDAGGDHAEENAVCYLQILLAEELEGMGSARMMKDMDAWGYTFRLGSARAWFESDAVETREWLMAHGLTDATGAVTFRLRQEG